MYTILFEVRVYMNIYMIFFSPNYFIYSEFTRIYANIF
jgi:hypothetical protein